jgi:hypothetical protein
MFMQWAAMDVTIKRKGHTEFLGMKLGAVMCNQQTLGHTRGLSDPENDSAGNTAKC